MYNGVSLETSTKKMSTRDRVVSRGSLLHYRCDNYWWFSPTWCTQLLPFVIQEGLLSVGARRTRWPKGTRSSFLSYKPISTISSITSSENTQLLKMKRIWFIACTSLIPNCDSNCNRVMVHY